MKLEVIKGDVIRGYYEEERPPHEDCKIQTLLDVGCRSIQVYIVRGCLHIVGNPFG